MKKPIALTGAALLTVGLAACGSGGSSKDPSGSPAATFSPSKLATTTPAGSKTVDSVTWGVPTGEPRSLDPVKAGTDSEYVILGNMCEHLLALNPDFSVGAGLATSAEWANPVTLVINLRKDVKFWDGKPMTPADVVYSLRRNMDPKTGSVNIGQYAGVKSIAASGAHQVTVHMKFPDSQFRNSLATTSGTVIEKAYSSAHKKSFGTAAGGLMCTGPFEFKSWKSGKNIVATANPHYWNGDPKTHKLTFEFIADNSTLTSALLSGEIDGAYDVPLTSADSFEKSKTGSLHFGPSTATLSFGPASASGPASKPVVRRALDLAIDKSAFVQNVLKGYGTTVKTFNPPLTFTGLPEADIYQKGYDALPARKQDLAKAKKLIAGAHLKTTDLVLAIPSGNEQLLQTATIVQAAAKKIGLTMQIKQMQAVDFAGLFYSEKARKGIDFVATMGYLNAPGPISNASFFAQPAPRGLFNWSKYNNPKVTKLLTKAEQSIRPKEAARNFVAAQKIFAHDNLQVSLGLKYSNLYLSDKLSGATVSFAYIGSPWALHLGGK